MRFLKKKSKRKDAPVIVGVGGDKGGPGKTTLVTNLAPMRAAKKKGKNNRSVLLIDTEAKGSTFWSRTRSAAKIEPLIYNVQLSGLVHAEIEKMDQKFDDIVIDLAGGDSEEMRSALIACDKFIVPIYPGQYDLWSVSFTIKAVLGVQKFNPGLETLFVINRAATNPAITETEEAIEAIKENLKSVAKNNPKIRLSKTILHDRIAFRKASREGLAVTELRPKDPKAIKETTSLFKEVYHGHN